MSQAIDTMKQDAFSAADVRALLDYDPDTGIFTYLPRLSGSPVDQQFNSRSAGKLAGARNTKGYIRIGLCGHKFAAGRLAWLYMTGDWPKGEIDHIDRNPSNNSWVNLRDVTEQQNQTNKGLSKRNKSGVSGVRWLDKWGKWKAGIHADGKSVHLGLFDSREEAINARLAAERDHGWIKDKAADNGGRL